MDTKNIERYLNSFGKQVVNRAKGNLQKAKGGGTALEGSIKFEVVPDGDGFSVKFYMADYGTFIDKGVSGNKKKQSFKDYLGKIISSPYKYTTKQPPPNILAKWIAFIIGRKIKRDGIKSLAFFQKPLGLGLKQFGQELLGNVKEDIINNLTTVN